MEIFRQEEILKEFLEKEPLLTGQIIKIKDTYERYERIDYLLKELKRVQNQIKEFTKELENAMLDGRADIAVHSLKDVPTTFPDGLKLACVCSREDINDAMLSMNFKCFDELPNGARVGTTSLRRRMQLLALRPDLEIISLRGNVNSRIAKLKDGEFDAIILAMAGINRLDLSKEVKYVSVLNTIAAMGQGALGIEAVDRADILEAIEFLNDEKSVIETTIERAFVHKLNGGCQAPIGVSARLDGDKIFVRAILGTPDGKEILKNISYLYT